MLTVKYKLSGLFTKIFALFLPTAVHNIEDKDVDEPEEKAVQTRFKEHLFSFTRGDER